MAGKESYQRGRETEAFAARYLQQQGYQILERNFRGGGGELDLVAQKGQVIYFVEVRARQGGLSAAGESIAPYKQQRLHRAALSWLSRHYQMETMSTVFLAVLLALDRQGNILDCKLVETSF